MLSDYNKKRERFLYARNSLKKNLIRWKVEKPSLLSFYCLFLKSKIKQKWQKNITNNIN